MIVSELAEIEGVKVRFMYKQRELPWYKKLIGMRYGPHWHLEVYDRPYENPLRSYDQDRPPNPARVMAVLMETYQNGER